MKSIVIEKEIKKFPESIQNAVRFNLELLALTDFDKSQEEVEEYLEYVSKRIILVDSSPESNSGAQLTMLAYVANKEDYQYFESHLDSTFAALRSRYAEKKYALEYKLQAADEYRDYLPMIRKILLAYVTRLRSDNVAEKMRLSLEEEKAVGFESILKKKKNHYAQNNLLTKSGFSESLSVVQKKLLNYFIFKFQHKCEEDLFGESFFTVTTQELVKCGCGSNQTAIVKCLKDLMENTTMYLQYKNEWGIYNLFSSFKGAVNKNVISVRFSPEMSALINKVGISRNYTLLSLNSINSIKRYSTMRMYELCSQYRNADTPVVYITDDDLRAMLNCKEKYPNPKDFKKYILKVAEKELKTLADSGKVDLFFTCHDVEKVKEDWEYDVKKVVKWAFVIQKSSTFEDGYIPHDTMEKRVEVAMRMIEEIVCNRINVDDVLRKSYLTFVRSLSNDNLVALVQDLQLDVLFSAQKESLASVETVFRKYGYGG